MFGKMAVGVAQPSSLGTNSQSGRTYHPNTSVTGEGEINLICLA